MDRDHFLFHKTGFGYMATRHKQRQTGIK